MEWCQTPGASLSVSVGTVEPPYAPGRHSTAAMAAKHSMAAIVAKRRTRVPELEKGIRATSVLGANSRG